MSKYWSPLVARLSPYVPGEQPQVEGIVKLNTNENPYGPSTLALDAMQSAIGESLRRYPDPNSTVLKQTIADQYDVDTTQVFVGNGSDEVLAHVFQALLKHDLPLLFPDISYSFYKTYAGLYEVSCRLVPLNDAFEIHVDDYLAPNGGIIFPNPNAPTGRLMPLREIERLLQANTESVVVVDEAYIDFGGESAIALVNRYPQLLVVQTFSKSRSLAGLRVGFAIGDAALIEALERVKNSFNSYPLDRVAQAGAVAALKDQAWFEQTRQAVMRDREWLILQLQAMDFDVLPSGANFIFARHRCQDAELILERLREQKVYVRHFRQPRIEQFLRISVGTRAECEALVKALAAADW